MFPVELFCGLGNPLIWWQIEFSFSDALVNLNLVISIEWIFTAGEKHVSDDSEGPDVALFVIFALDDLWGQIMSRPA